MTLSSITHRKSIVDAKFLIYIGLWILVHEVLISQFPNPAKIPSLHFLWGVHKSVSGILNEINFWSTSLGVVIYIFFEIVIVAFILFGFSRFFSIKGRFSKYLVIIITAHNIFLFQHILEGIFVIHNSNYFSNIQRENFSLLSISFFLNQANISFNSIFHYAFGVINVFEFIYWGLLIFFTMKIHHTNSANAIRVISFSYIPILFLWIITVTFINLMNSSCEQEKKYSLLILL